MLDVSLSRQERSGAITTHALATGAPPVVAELECSRMIPSPLGCTPDLLPSGDREGEGARRTGRLELGEVEGPLPGEGAPGRVCRRARPTKYQDAAWSVGIDLLEPSKEGGPVVDPHFAKECLAARGEIVKEGVGPT